MHFCWTGDLPLYSFIIRDLHYPGTYRDNWKNFEKRMKKVQILPIENWNIFEIVRAYVR
jgi:hypothetical protein